MAQKKKPYFQKTLYGKPHLIFPKSDYYAVPGVSTTLSEI